MSVSNYEELLDRNTRYIGGRRPDPDSVDSSAYVGGRRPAALTKAISRPDVTRPRGTTPSRQTPSRSRPTGSGGGGFAAMLNAVAGLGNRTIDNVTQRNGGLEKSARSVSAFDEIRRQRAIDDILAGMPGAFQGDVLSYLSQAQQAIGDGGLGNALNTIAGREQNYKEQAKQGDARLAAMYDQLRNSILEDSETISGNTNEAREGLREIASNEQQAINSAHQATQARQDEILGRLGIEDAAAIGIAQGDVQGRTQEQAIERAATRDAAAQQYTTSVGQNAQNFNTSNAAAAGMEGADRRAQLGTQLSSALAALQDERAATTNEYNSRNQQMALSLASQLYDNARSNWQSGMDNWTQRFNLSQGLDDRSFDQSMSLREMALREQAAQAEMSAASAAEIPWNQLGPSAQYNQQLQNQAGRQAGVVADVIGRNTQLGNRVSPVNAQAAVRELVDQHGMSPFEANSYVQQYMQAMGLG